MAKKIGEPHEGTLVLELSHNDSNGYEIWPVIESSGGPGWPVRRQEMDRETSRRSLAHDPREGERNEIAARHTAGVVANLARTRFGWRNVVVRG